MDVVNTIIGHNHRNRTAVGHRLLLDFYIIVFLPMLKGDSNIKFLSQNRQLYGEFIEKQMKSLYNLIYGVTK